MNAHSRYARRTSAAMAQSRKARLAPFRQSGGFSLIELMVAITLGLLLSIGIVSLFGSTSSTNRTQDALARLQENGRYAVVHVNDDMRMLGGQFCSNKSGIPTGTTGDTLAWGGRAPGVFAANLPLPDSGGAQAFPATGPTTAAATAYYALSPRWFVQGYECSTGTCTPSVASDIPTTGVANGKRVPKTDVLTVRYQRGTGWPMTAATCSTGGALTIAPQTGDDPVNFSAGNLALVTDCTSPNILPIRAVSGNTLTIGTTLTGASPYCGGNAATDTRVFNFSQDFVTVSYYLAFRNDENPGAPLNSTASTRLIPVLIRRENGTEQEVVQGVDRLDFLYGVQDGNGVTRYLDAGQVSDGLAGAITCTPQASGVASLEPGCLWRSVRSVEIHMLLDTVNTVGGLDPTSMSYNYSLDSPTHTTISSSTATLPSGLQAGNMMRREFVSLVSVRNYNQ